MKKVIAFKITMLSIVTSVVLGGCASTPNTYSSAAPDADFGSISTYGFFDQIATDKTGYESLETNFLKVAVAQQMDIRGLRYEPNNPDVQMNFYIHTEEKVRSRSTPTMGGGYYGYRGGLYDDFGYGGGMAYETRVEQYTQGTLTVDMIDPKTRKLLWEGTVAGRLTQKDVQNMESTVDLAVKDVFTKFPIP
jgi:hypothetical protein